VPLTELCALAGIVLIVLGFLTIEERRGGVLLACGLALGSLAGLDTVAREHFTGHRSHTSVLAGLPAIALGVAVSFAGAPPAAAAVAAVALLAAAVALLRRAFRRAAGGQGLR
jgi:hypothetical protein